MRPDSKVFFLELGTPGFPQLPSSYCIPGISVLLQLGSRKVTR